MDTEEARRRLVSLQALLRELAKRDPDQEARGIAVPVLDAVINATRAVTAPNDEIAPVIRDLIDPDAIAAGEFEVGASGALLAVDQLMHSLSPPPVVAPVLVRDEGIMNWWGQQL